MTQIHRTIDIFTDEVYYYEVHQGEEDYIGYIEEGLRTKQIFFGSKAEMKAVALAMLELSERPSLDRAVLAEKE